MSFAQTEAQAMPTLINAGVITSVEPVVLSKSGIFYTTPISIAGIDSSRAQKTYFTFRGDWFTTKTQQEMVEAGNVTEFFKKNYEGQTYTKGDVEKDVVKSFTLVYQSNIANAEDNSFLQCLFPNSEDFEEFANALLAENFELAEDASEEELSRLTAFLQEHLQGRKIGYVLAQKSVPGAVDPETGKRTYTKLNEYEIKSMFPITEKAIKSRVNSAKKSRNTRILFNPDTVLD